MTVSLDQRIEALEQRLAKKPRSPLFAQLAGLYLEAGRPHEALRVCDQGLAYYPHYATAHLLKGRALVALKMTAEARREFELLHRQFPAVETISRFLEQTGGTVEIDFLPGASETPEKEPAVTTSRTIKVGFSVEQVSSAPQEKSSPSMGFVEAPTQQPPVTEPAPFVEAPADGSPVGEFTEEVVQPTESPFGSDAAREAVEGETISEPSAPEAIAEPGSDAFGFSETAGDTFGIAAPSEEVFAAPQEEVEHLSGETERGVMEGFGDTASVTPVESGPETRAEESFEEFAARMRMELFGTENTLSLEEYLSLQGEEADSANAGETVKDTIDDLAGKLQNAKPITPVINLSERTAESGGGMSAGFVTPTLAEIYVKQGWYDDAIRAYRALAATKPEEREQFEKRIREVEELKKQQGS